MKPKKMKHAHQDLARYSNVRDFTKPTRPQKSNPVAEITQDELQLFFSLRVCSRQYKALRVNIVDRIKNGASIELGAMAVHIEEKESKSFSYGRLSEVIGEELTHQLREMLPLTVHTHLLVTIKTSDESQ